MKAGRVVALIIGCVVALIGVALLLGTAEGRRNMTSCSSEVTRSIAY